MLALVWATFALAGPALSGNFQLAEDPASLQATHAAAVDAAVASMAWLMRPIARPFLKNSVKNCARMQLDLTGEVFRLQCDAQPPLVRPIGPARTELVGDDGETYGVGLEVTDAWVQLTFTGERGGQKSRFEPQADGSVLLRKEIFSGHLPEPIVWTVRYRP
ncbi:MAG: hypothetical protein ACI8PZ_003127 [Myxococcota bacterium]|jgi:hypothetical protein